MPISEPGPLRQLRLAVGIHHLLTPTLGAETLLGKRLDDRAGLVVRVLGARYLAQALVSGAAPTGAVLVLGAEVDAAHAASMMVLALLDRRRRRETLASALIAGGFAVAGARAARAAPPLSAGGPDRTFGLAAWRDQVADQVARRWVPGYPWDARLPIRPSGADLRRRLTTGRPQADGAATR